MESPLFLFDKAMERFLAIKEKLLLVTDRQDIIDPGNILRDRSQKPFIFRQITASVSLSFGNYRSKTDCWLWPTSFPFRYSVGEIPTYCLKYLPKKDWVEKFSSEAISLILKSEERSICLASAMTMRMIHCRAEMPDFSLMIAEK